MKGQAKIVSVLLIVLIATVAMATVLPWTYNMVQKKQDMKSVDDVYNFFQTLDDTIRNIAQNGGEESLQLKVPGKFTINPHDGVAGVWHFNENEGCTVNDESLNGNNGIFKPTCSDPTWTGGKSGSGLEFDGINDYVEIPTSESLNFSSTCQFTQAAWIYPKNPPHDFTGPPKWYGFLGYELPPPGSGHTIIRTPSLWICNNTKIHVGFGNGTHWLSAVTDDVITNNAWNYVAVTFNGTHYKVYVNGVKKYENDTAKYPVGGGNFKYCAWDGQCPNPYYARVDVGRVDVYFNGNIDEVAIYNRALTPEEIYNHYKHGILINSIRFSFISKVSNVAEGNWIPLNTPNSYDIGTLGVDSPSVIFAKAEKDADEIEVQNRLWYRELEDQSGHGYRIILNTSNNEIVDTTTGFMRIQRLKSREILTESLTITEINIIV